jgi:hypothetical protein
MALYIIWDFWYDDCLYFAVYEEDNILYFSEAPKMLEQREEDD